MEMIDNFLQDKYKKKRAIIIGVYAAIFLLFVYGLFSWLKPVPSCLDNVKNQDEKGVDCGGICPNKCPVVAEKPFEVRKTGFVDSGVPNSYDLYAQVVNPNQTLGSSKFNYIFTIKDANGATLATRGGFGFILPGETKYVIENNLALSNIPAKVEITISNPVWIESTEFYEKPQLKVVNKKYSEISNGVGFGEATGLLKNESPLDFTNIKLEIILKDADDNVIALNSTEMNTVQVGENRDFRAVWPNRFPGSVANMEVQVGVNVFKSDAFVRKNFKPEKFQQY